MSMTYSRSFGDEEWSEYEDTSQAPLKDEHRLPGDGSDIDIAEEAPADANGE